MTLKSAISGVGGALQSEPRPTSLIVPPSGTTPGLAWERRTDSRTAALRLFFPGGSSLDGDTPGISHVLEHVLASGDGSAEARSHWTLLTSAGAVVQGETAREYISVGVECRVDQWRLAVRALAAFVRQAIPEPEACRRATQSVVAEALGQSTHQSFIWNVIASLLWGGHPMARPTVGDPTVVRHLSCDQITAHHRTLAVQGAVWLGACGVPDVDALRAEVEALDWGLGPGTLPEVSQPEMLVKGRRLDLERNVTCSYVAVAWPVPGGFGIEAQALRLVETALGGPNGILAGAMRHAGLGEDVYAGAGMYRRTGYLAVWAKCLPGEEERVVPLLTTTVSAVPEEMNLERARQAYETRTWLRLESSYRMAGAAAVYAMTGGPTLAEWVRLVTTVDLTKVVEISTRYLRPKRAFVVVVRLPPVTIGGIRP